jgi:hypothetical protein
MSSLCAIFETPRFVIGAAGTTHMDDYGKMRWFSFTLHFSHGRRFASIRPIVKRTAHARRRAPCLI